MNLWIKVTEMSQSTASLLKSGDNVVQGDTTTDSMRAFSQKK